MTVACTSTYLNLRSEFPHNLEHSTKYLRQILHKYSIDILFPRSTLDAALSTFSSALIRLSHLFSPWTLCHFVPRSRPRLESPISRRPNQFSAGHQSCHPPQIPSPSNPHLHLHHQLRFAIFLSSPPPSSTPTLSRRTASRLVLGIILLAPHRPFPNPKPSLKSPSSCLRTENHRIPTQSAAVIDFQFGSSLQQTLTPAKSNFVRALVAAPARPTRSCRYIPSSRIAAIRHNLVSRP